MKLARYAIVLAASIGLLLLSGCAAMNQLGSDVQTQSSLKSLPVAGYRFERLPSQQTPELVQNQSTLEAMAQKALALVGFKRDDAKPGYSVLVSARVQRDLRVSMWDDPFYGNRFNMGFSNVRGRAGMRGGVYFGGGGFYPRYDPTLHREVSVVMRDLSTGQVVYETQAFNDSLWADSNAVFPLMFEAAVSGFPTPPSGRRMVNINVTPPAPPLPAPPPAAAPTMAPL
jgi:hypothetical protein